MYPENKTQNTGIAYPDDGSSLPSSSFDSQALSRFPDSPQMNTPDPTQNDGRRQKARRLAKSGSIAFAALLLVSGMVWVLVSATKGDANLAITNPASDFETTAIPLSELSIDVGIAKAETVAVNGSLTLNGGLTLSPSLQPASAQAGQIYYDKDTNQLAYYNGSQFVAVSAQGQVVQSVGGVSGQLGVGNGLGIVGDQLVNAGVLSVGGQTGAISVGNGLTMVGGSLQNSGIVSLVSASPALTVTNDGNGNITLNGSGAGTVSSSGGTVGRVALFTGAQNIEDSIITQSGFTVTISGDLNIITGGLSLSNALTVSNGGTGASSLAANGLLLGNGTSPISTVTSGGPGLCLISTAGAPNFAACPSASGVTSLNGLTGGLSVANASAAGSVITIDNAGAVAKGIASFDGTNFSVVSGAVNTIQNINSGAIPTFAGVNTNNITPSAALTVGISAQTALLQGSTTTITSSGVGNDIILNSADTIELQDNTNVTGSIVASGDVAVNGGDLTSTGSLNITPGGALTAGVSAQTLTLQGNGSTTLRATDAGNTTIVGFASPTANTTLNFPALTAGTYTICTTSGNCTGTAVSLQSAYDNSTNPEIVLDATRGAVTIRDSVAPLGANLLEVQNNGGGITYLAVTASGLTVTGTATSSGNLNTTGGAVQTNSTTRIDNSGNLTNIGTLTLSGAISGGTSFSGSGNVNTTGGVIQTNSTTRIDNSGNLTNIGTVAASGSATFQGGSLTLGTNAQAGTVVLNDGSSNTGTLQVAALGQNTIYTLPDPGTGTVSICLTTGNCAGSGGGVTGAGTNNRITKFTSTGSTVGDSTITDDGTAVSTTVDLVIQGGDATIGVASTQTGTLNFADSSSAFLGSIVQGGLGANRTYTLPDASGTVCLSSGNCLGGGGGGANVSLSNLTSVAINTTLLPGTAGTVHLGSGTLPFGDAFLAGSSGTPGANNFRITGTSTSGTRVITLPDASGTVCLQSSASCGFAPSTGSTSYIQNQIASPQTSANFSIDGDGRAATFNGVTGINTGAGAGTQRIDASGNLSNIASVTLSGSISGGTTFTGSGNINTTGGALQTNTVTRIDVSGNIINIGNITGTGAVTIASSGASNDIIINGADTLDVQDATTFASSVDISGTATLTGDVALNGTNIVIGDTSSDLVTVNGIIQGGSPLVFEGGTADGSELTIAIASLGGDQTITFPDATGTVCLTTGNCAGSGGGVTTAGGSMGTIPVFTGAQTIGDSLVSQTGATVTVNGHLNIATGNQYQINGTQISSGSLSNNADIAKLSSSQTFAGNTNAFQNSINSINAFNVQNAIGSRILTVDTTNGELELGVGSVLDGRLVFANLTNSNTVTIIPGTPSVNRTLTLPNADGIICTDSGNCAGVGATLQTGYNFSAGGTTPKIKLNNTLNGVDIQDADTTIGTSLFNVRASNGVGLGSAMLSIGNTGAITLQNSVNSATALMLLTQGGTTVLVGDTTNGQVILGQSTTLDGKLVFNNAINTNQITLTTAAAGGPQTITLPNSTGTVCLTSGNCAGVGGTGDILQGGNTFGTAVTIGTNDAFDLNLETGGVPRLTVESDGSQVTFASNVDVVLQGATAFVSNSQGQSGSESFGLGATLSDGKQIAIGAGASVSAGEGGIAIGYSANVASSDGVAIGNNAGVGFLAIGIGNTALVQQESVGVGNLVNVDGQYSVGIGASTNVAQNHSIALGHGATTTAANQLVIGSSSHAITRAVIGNGVTNAAPDSFTLQGTSGSGSNIAGASINIAGGQGTGTGNGGSLNFQIADPGTTGSSLNALATVMSLSGTNGAATFQNSTNSASAFRVLNTGGESIINADTLNRVFSVNGAISQAITANDPPQMVAAMATTNYRNSQGIDVQGNYAYIVSDNSVKRFSIVDITNPASPVEVSSTNSTTNLFYPKHIRVKGNYAYIVNDVDTPSSGRPQFVIYDISNPNSPTLVGSINDDVNFDRLQSMEVVGGYAYVASRDGDSFSVIDITNPTAPSRIATTASDATNFNGPKFITVQGKYAYVSMYEGDGLSVVDISDPDAPVRVSTVGSSALNGAHGSAIYGKYLYVAAENNHSFTVVNIEDPLAPVIGTALADATVLNLIQDIDIFGRYAVVAASGADRLSIIDLSSPASPVLLSNTQDATNLDGVQKAIMYGRYIYAVGDGDDISSSVGAFSIWEIGGFSATSADIGELRTNNLFADGDARVSGILTVQSGLTVGGSASIQGTFSVNGGSGVPLLIANIATSRVNIGNPVADTTGALLVLDTKSGSGDPTGVNGGMYYNASIGKMRCYENDFWRDCIYTARTAFFISSDFISNGTDSNFTFGTNSLDGTGNSSTGTTSVAGHPGIVEHNTGTTSTGRASIMPAGENGILLGNNDAYRFEAVIRIPTLSDVTNTFTYRTGFIDDNDIESTDGCFFRYTHGTLSGNWQGVCRSNSVESTCDTTVAAGLNTWSRLTVIVNAAGNSVDFQTGGVSRCQVTTNIPTGAGRGTSFGSMLKKSAGTTNRTVDVDYIEVQGSLGTPR